MMKRTTSVPTPDVRNYPAQVCTCSEYVKISFTSSKGEPEILFMVIELFPSYVPGYKKLQSHSVNIHRKNKISINPELPSPPKKNPTVMKPKTRLRPMTTKRLYAPEPSFFRVMPYHRDMHRYFERKLGYFQQQSASKFWVSTRPIPAPDSE